MLTSLNNSDIICSAVRIVSKYSHRNICILINNTQSNFIYINKLEIFLQDINDLTILGSSTRFYLINFLGHNLIFFLMKLHTLKKDAFNLLLKN